MQPQEKHANLIQSIALMIKKSKKTKIAEHLNGEEEMLKQVWLPEWIIPVLEGIEEFLRSVSEHEKIIKQDTMKPTYDHRYAEMGCSMCGSMLGGWEERPSYCPQCGQAIDWSEE